MHTACCACLCVFVCCSHGHAMHTACCTCVVCCVLSPTVWHAFVPHMFILCKVCVCLRALSVFCCVVSHSICCICVPPTLHTRCKLRVLSVCLLSVVSQCICFCGAVFSQVIEGQAVWSAGWIELEAAAVLSIAAQGSLTVQAHGLSVLTNGGGRSTGERIENYSNITCMCGKTALRSVLALCCLELCCAFARMCMSSL